MQKSTSEVNTNPTDSKDVKSEFETELTHLAEDKFPVDTLPEPCARLVKEAEQTLNLDPAFTSSATLIVLSTVIGKSRLMYLKKKRVYPATLFIGMVGKPGSGKTPAEDLIFQPLEDHDSKTFQDFNKKLEALKDWENLPKEEKKASEPPETPIWNRKLLDDHTPEVLADVLNENPKGICLKTDELATWFESFQRYNPGPDLERWLSIWSTSNYSVTRKNGPPIFVPKPFCSVVGGIQPAVLPRLFNGERANNGFTDRILFALETPNRPTDEWKEAEITQRTYNNYESLVNQLDALEPGEFEDGNLKPDNIYLTQPAMNVWKEYYDQIQKRIRTAEDHEASLLSKLEQYVPRLTLILALGNDPQTTEATKDDVNNAIRIVEYFESTARKVREMAGIGGSVPDTKTIIKYCVNACNAQQSEVAKALGVNKSYVSNVLKGKK